MKKILIPVITLILSANIMAAAPEGFREGGVPPPAGNQDAGHRGSGDTVEGATSNTRQGKNDTWVTLRGHFIKKIGHHTYDFRDKSGVIRVTVPQGVWRGEEYDTGDLVNLSGYMRGEGKKRYINADPTRVMWTRL